MAQNELFARRDQHRHAGQLPRHSPYRRGTRMVLKKYAAWMIHLPNIYTFCKQFVLALHDLLCNEVLKKGYNAEFSAINQLYETAHMIEEASHYNHRM